MPVALERNDKELIFSLASFALAIVNRVQMWGLTENEIEQSIDMTYAWVSIRRLILILISIDRCDCISRYDHYLSDIMDPVQEAIWGTFCR